MMKKEMSKPSMIEYIKNKISPLTRGLIDFYLNKLNNIGILSIGFVTKIDKI